MPVISFSDYKNISVEADLHFTEESLTGTNTLGLLTSQLEYLEEETFKLKQDNIELIRKNSTEHVVLPYRLIMNEGFVVSDELFKKLVPVKTEKFTGFFINEFEKTTGMGGSLVVDRVSSGAK